MTLSAAILAGGNASRFGGLDKSALRLDGQSIFDLQLAVLGALTSSILIVGTDSTRFRASGIPVFADRVPGAGALGGIYTALVEAPGDHVLVIACDMPFLTRPFLAHLVAEAAHVDVAIPKDADGRRPLCAVFASRLAPHLRACMDAGRLRVRDALHGLQVREIGPEELARYDVNGRLLMNVNTPDDYLRATGV
jgi:molybdopterin-guanine dinucleotide biosynthesis protein A